MALEAIGVASSIVGVAEVGLKLSHHLYEYIGKYRHAESRLAGIAGDIRTTSAVLQQVAEVFGDERHVKLWKQSALKAATQVEKQCFDAFREIKLALHETAKTDSSNHITVSFKSRAAWPFKEPKMLVLLADLERAKSTLSIMLSTVTLARTLDLHTQANVQRDKFSDEATRKTVAKGGQARDVTAAIVKTDSMILMNADSGLEPPKAEPADVAKDRASLDGSPEQEKAALNHVVTSNGPVFTQRDVINISACLRAVHRLLDDLRLTEDIINAAGQCPSTPVSDSLTCLVEQCCALPSAATSEPRSAAEVQAVRTALQTAIGSGIRFPISHQRIGVVSSKTDSQDQEAPRRHARPQSTPTTLSASLDSSVSNAKISRRHWLDGSMVSFPWSKWLRTGGKRADASGKNRPQVEGPNMDGDIREVLGRWTTLPEAVVERANV